jgi:PTS system mannitol-specific IIC component
MSNFTPAATGTDVRARIQRFGSYLSGMVMPNIGAFIAFGLITALFIPDGWTPNADLAEMVGPMIVVLIPTLIAYTGGKQSRPSARSSRRPTRSVSRTERRCCRSADRS